jgi:chlorite dismutase
MSRLGVGIAILWLLLFGFMVGTPCFAAERERLLADPGVYVTFAVFQADHDWWSLAPAAKQSALAEAGTLLARYRETLALDTYLLRGLSDHADFMIRVHGRELRDIQTMIVDVLATTFGKHLSVSIVLNGLTKKANYVPGFPDTVKNDLKAPTDDPGPKPYAIVIPIRKDAEWWALDQEKRTALMLEHTGAALPYLKSVKRKLYHSSGLDDLDFITYFETAKMEDFHELILALERVKENKHNRRFGHPTLIGTKRSWEELTEKLGR